MILAPNAVIDPLQISLTSAGVRHLRTQAETHIDGSGDQKVKPSLEIQYSLLDLIHL